MSPGHRHALCGVDESLGMHRTRTHRFTAVAPVGANAPCADTDGDARYAEVGGRAVRAVPGVGVSCRPTRGRVRPSQARMRARDSNRVRPHASDGGGVSSQTTSFSLVAKVLTSWRPRGRSPADKWHPRARAAQKKGTRGRDPWCFNFWCFPIKLLNTIRVANGIGVYRESASRRPSISPLR